jgi:hypothetical protein
LGRGGRGQHDNLAAIIGYPGNNRAASMSMNFGQTVASAPFIDPGPVTADCNRRAKTPRDSITAAFSVFPTAEECTIALTVP